MAKARGLFRELNPGPLAPEARIMPLDQAAMCGLHKMHMAGPVAAARSSMMRKGQVVFATYHLHHQIITGCEVRTVHMQAHLANSRVTDMFK